MHIRRFFTKIWIISDITGMLHCNRGFWWRCIGSVNFWAYLLFTITIERRIGTVACNWVPKQTTKITTLLFDLFNEKDMETKDVQHACSGSTSKITTNCSFTWCQLFFYQWNTLMKLLMFCSLWPGKTACCHRYWSTLVQVMVWCFSSTSPLFESVLTNELHWAYNFQF